MRKDKRSFTLIEVIVVMIIIGILVAIAVPKYTTGITQRATVTSAKAGLTSLSSAYLRYWMDTDAGRLENMSQLDMQLTGCTGPADDNCCDASDARFCFSKKDAIPTSGDDLIADAQIYKSGNTYKCKIEVYWDMSFSVSCPEDASLETELEKYL